ncbi:MULTISPECIES: Cys-tRNA(Pro) deacylase [Cetobacterium]|uniref:Cys-tRNA(Pro)/Cys-tRNA(Cys) deacylase n=1 Tax=Candidatus Cetobacterium colombiensis TaxID=3073100 RepID=A0ABU4W6N9_9FUSO|nr:Cys-tRNA(Pro) deacylase [Candidatus Cetobacterium colombiensis]MDX8335191.1 Cys-tRNA(Pro) deacylase [Candidatus Cetobacterium colombiensis]
MKKTNAMRELDRSKIKYEVIEYEVDENYLGAISVATKTGNDITKVFKTLAITNDKDELFIACIPGSDELDLKKMASAVNSKKVEMLELNKLKEKTGYIRGGCSPIGIKKRHLSLIHESCLKKDFIFISGGQKGLQIKIKPTDLISFLNMKVENIIIE